MKKILFFLLLTVTFFANAQSNKIYATIQYSNDYVEIDYGNDKGNKKLVDKNGDVIKFHSFAGALNYLSKLGWQLDGSLTRVGGSVFNGIGAVSSHTDFIISRECSKTEFDSIANLGVKKITKK